MPGSPSAVVNETLPQPGPAHPSATKREARKAESSPHSSEGPWPSIIKVNLLETWEQLGLFQPLALPRCAQPRPCLAWPHAMALGSSPWPAQHLDGQVV